AWLRRGAPARTRKPKARTAAATAIVEGRAPAADRPGDLDLGGGGQWGTTPRLGSKVVELHAIGHRFGARPPLFDGIELDLGPGDRLGLVGPNGSGKSTLLDIMSGRLTPATGRVDSGPTVRLGYYDQTGRELDPAQRVREAVAGSQGQPSWEQARLMERFWFDSDAQWAPIATLSGGEQRRLQLLLVLATLPNVLLLDEPSNDLDLDTLRTLEDYLDTWPGTVVVASHDRAFLERTVEDVLVLDGIGGAAIAPGGYAGYAAARAAARAGGANPRGVAPAPATTPSTTPASATATTLATPTARPGAPDKVRSPSTLRRLLGLSEREMAAAAADRDRLVAALSVATNDHIALTQIAHSLADAEVRLAQAEERWLALAEELGG
ncbi:MAG: ATP-binding cassette domain-containing protein, partial [Actinomycetota bacterium]|nr:ATP-binding cassette domain-containing protein [Actinomycetota bacterium]